MDESLEAKIARIDERTELMLTKIDGFCTWKDEAAKDLHTLKKANLPGRVTNLEQWRWYIAGALALIILITGSGRIIEFFYVVPHHP